MGKGDLESRSLTSMRFLLSEKKKYKGTQSPKQQKKKYEPHTQRCAERICRHTVQADAVKHPPTNVNRSNAEKITHTATETEQNEKDKNETPKGEKTQD